MFESRLPGDRFFARLVSLDLECPGCANVYALRPGTHLLPTSGRPAARTERARAVWNRRTGRFKCPSCGLTLALGVVAYPCSVDPHMESPADAVPTLRQALNLRQQYTALLTDPSHKWSFKEPRNVVLKEGCKCEPLETGALWIHPNCPHHGHARKP